LVFEYKDVKIMKNRLLTSKDFKTSKWSGGDTTELFISPEGARLKEGNFNIRLSTATVEVEKSVFTKLPSISRTLVVLDGKMRLEHKGKHVKVLSKFNVDYFEGDWSTTSYGTCVDFNVMTTNGRASKVTPFSLMERDEVVLQSCIEAEASFLYVYKGAIDLSIGKERKELLARNLFVLSKCDVLEIKVLEKSEILLIEVLK